MDGERHAWIDASAGIAGDMLLGALVDAGASVSEVQAAVDAVIPGAVLLRESVVARAGLRAVKLDVEITVDEPPHRPWRDLRPLIDESALDARVRGDVLRVFTRLAEAEGRTHGVEPDDVEFHEVGAVDSIADVVGVCAALRALGVGTVSVGPIALGSGVVRGEHGRLPVPVPAVLEMARGWAVTGEGAAGAVGASAAAGAAGELATPTGMALATVLAERGEPLPAMRVDAVGVGAGTRDPDGRPNVVRVVVGERAEQAERPDAGPSASAMWVLESNVDDLDPRVWPTVLSELLDAGAADAWLVPIIMKKGRPAHTLSVLCPAGRRAALRRLVFDLTSTIGVREYEVERWALCRRWVDVDVEAGVETGRVRVKVSGSDGIIVQATPEFDDVAALAGRAGVPVRVLLDRAAAAAARSSLAPGNPMP